ncbi:hypothetical protein GCM10011380_26470 [Sphingomonas metalli]|uniref:Porin n=1 Tax=Sphingomonas metalli TaxID=1779358 RepID=A0A916T8J3_9SPHN|nr:TorF family putative porin [Sphingomonas metalli]GGB35781.1 hypothetical protein GCM10011380_26470 [Sphingomonas metalli]
MRVVAGGCALAAAVPAVAQSTLGAGVEATTDERRRGLSWSGGDPSLSADAYGSFGAIDAGARIAATRGSPRHAGADAVADLSLGTGWDVSGLRLGVGATAHLFTGADRRMDYGELTAEARYTLGPAQLTLGADYAPDQAAIGGDNLYLRAGATLGIPSTPFTLLADVGRSSGSVDDPDRAARLRPAGRYTDWRVGVEHVTGPLTLAVEYVGSDIARDAVTSSYGDGRHSGDRLVARARFGF